METPDVRTTLRPGDMLRWYAVSRSGTEIVRSYTVIELEGEEYLSRDLMILSDDGLHSPSAPFSLSMARKTIAGDGALGMGRLVKVYDRATNTWLEDRS